MPPKPPPPRSYLPRKLLVAALGVATINYVGVIACGGATEGSGTDKDKYPPTSGNLPSPDPPDQYVPPPTSGNLPSPEPMDAALDADSSNDGGGSDGGDAG